MTGWQWTQPSRLKAEPYGVQLIPSDRCRAMAVMGRQRSSLVGNRQPAGKVQVPESVSRRGLPLIIDGEGARFTGRFQ
jgi:hypothetical protein